MKKISTLFLSIAVFTTFANATIYYVDPVNGLSTNNGLTWNTAKQTVTEAFTLANANAGVDDIYVKGGTISFTQAWAVGNSKENYYGSFAGNETSPAERPHADVDGNGIVEDWEFQNPTILSFITNTNALTLPNQDIQFDGFTITHTGSSTTAHLRTVTLGNNLARFWNNTIKNCNLSMPILTSGATTRSIILKSFGSVSNCLFEKNTISATSAKSNGAFQLIEVMGTGSAPTLTAPGSKFTNNVIRNNKVTANFSASTYGTANVRGMILQIDPSATTGAYTTVSNCLIHNNEIEMITNITYPTANATLVSINNTANGKDSVMNNTIANNKGINVKSAGLGIVIVNTCENTVLNNAIWNNQVGDVQNNIFISGGIANLSTTSSFKSNINSGGVVGLEENTTNVVNNLSDLSSGNTGTYAPLFKSPSSAIGITTDLSAETSNWRLNVGSYLIGKGIAATNLKDKAGVLFSMPRSVGSYEYIADISTFSEGIRETMYCFFSINRKITSTIEAKVQVMQLDGKIIKSLNVMPGQSIELKSGIYILRYMYKNALIIQKIII